MPDNALPQLAQATVNCRVLPGESIEEVQKTLVRVVNDDQVSVEAHVDCGAKPAVSAYAGNHGSHQAGDVRNLAGHSGNSHHEHGRHGWQFSEERWNPTYGTSGLAMEVDDVRSHGRDERVPVKSFYPGQEYLYRLVKLLAGGK